MRSPTRLILLLLVLMGLVNSKASLCTTTKRLSTFTGYTVLRQILSRDANDKDNYTVVYCVDDQPIYMYQCPKTNVKLTSFGQYVDVIKDTYRPASIIGILKVKNGTFPLMISTPAPFIVVNHKLKLESYIPLFHTPSTEEII